MKINFLKWMFSVFVVTLLFSCNYNSNKMMKTPKDYTFSSSPTEKSPIYVLAVSDIIQLKLYTNDGTSLIDFTAIDNAQGVRQAVDQVQYLIDFDGFCKLPILGKVELRGKTLREAEKYLEELYSKYYIKPFVVVRVLNRRITIFTGGGGSGKVVTLQNENVNLVEALALAGGLTDISKAKRIKLVRGDLSNPQVFLFDFSTLEGIKAADFVMQANDIVYVEFRGNIVREAIRDIAPIISLITSTLTLIIVVDRLNAN
ncbi:MAG: polysaccharide biosynthesis/export family protein [Vicingaceae bacterium]|nr:polysaccharide biosynthesis/export family protein [Vicingaceae bacterium]